MARQRRPRRGEIWMAYTPGQPKDPHQPRPSLVVSDDVRNRLRDDVITVPIFSRGSPGPTHVRLSAGVGGIRHDSVLVCEEIMTLDLDFLDRGPLGATVPRDVLDGVTRAVRRSLGEVVAEP